LGIDLTPQTIERLVELDRKFAREGLTFDDVLLVPCCRTRFRRERA
jgi:hypothetical protein